MFEFESFTLRDTVPHKLTKIHFDEGINVVRGANYSGKSVMFNLLCKILTRELPYAASKNKKENTGILTVVFRKHDIKYEIRLNLTTGRYTIIENGKLLDYKNMGSAVEKVDEILPFTLSAFQNFSYLSNDSFPYMLRGTPVQRKVLFEQLFDIDTTDQYKFFQKMEKRLHGYAERYEALSNLDVETVFGKELRTKQKKITEVEKRHADLLKAYEKSVDYEKLLLECQGDWNELTLTQLQKRLEELNPVALQKEFEAAKDYEAYLRNKDEHDRLQKKKKGLDNYKSVDIPLDTLQRLVSILDSDDKRFDEFPSKRPVYRDTGDKEATLEVLAARAKRLKHAETCPYCETSLAGKKLETLLEKLRKDYIKIQKEIADYETGNEDYATYRDVIDASTDLDWETVITVYSDIDYFIKHLEYVTVCKEIDICKCFLSDKVTKTRSLNDIKKDLDNCLAERDEIQAELALRDYIKKHGVPEKIDKRELENLQDRIVTLREDLSTLTASHQHYREIRVERTRLQHQLQMKPVVTSLKNLYGPKGLRLMRVKEAIHVFIDRLNDVSKSILPGYVFTYDVSDTGIDIMCNRKAGKSDIRRFSASEGKLLSIISLMALHPILPAERKSNLLILDEIEASMRSDTRKRFISLLPDLQSLYPSIWLITPQERSVFPIELGGEVSVNEYSVKMDDNGNSTLKAANE